MKARATVAAVFALARQGRSQTDIALGTGVSQATVSRWLHTGEAAVLGSPRRRRATDQCPAGCPRRVAVDRPAYAYLLGQYLGDGWIGEHPRDVYRLTIACCAQYPVILGECRAAMRDVLPGNVVGQRERPGVVELSCYSKHLPCLFPQHGPGYKHTRSIVLEPWQRAIALDEYPALFVRGLIHSDGCRSTNRVRNAAGRQYEYPRYMFSNRSADIRRLFADGCDALGVEWRPMNRVNVSVARRESVSLLDSLVGPKS